MRKLEPDNKKTVIGDQWTGNEDSKPSFLCEWCSCTLSRLQDAGHNNTMLWCSRCHISYDEQDNNLRKESKIFVPDTDTDPAITSVGFNYYDDVSINHSVPVRGGFAELQKKGLKIKDYHTTERQ